MLRFLSKFFDLMMNTYGNLLVSYSVKSREKKAFLVVYESPYFSE